MQNLVFQSSQDFIQAAFNQVAKIVSEHGHPCLDAFVPAKSTEQCLSHLALVCYEWSYDPALIDAYAETYKTANAEFEEYLGE